MASDRLPGVDGVLVVNLDRRPERWVEFQQTWADILPWDRVERLSASDGVLLAGYGQAPWFHGRKRDRTWAGRGGCTLSHARAMRLARERGWDRVLVLEDDAVPTPAIDRLGSILSASDAPMLYLGCHDPRGPFRDLGEGIKGVQGALETHAYVVSAPVRDWLIDHMPDEATVWPWTARERAVDRWYRREVGRHFTIGMANPPLVVQREGVSDIVNSWRAVDHPEWVERPAAPLWLFEIGRLGSLIADRVRAAAKRIAGF